MTDDDVQNEGEIDDAPTSASPRRGRLMAMAVVVGALALGGGGGVLLVGPAVAERVTSAPEEPEEKAPEEVSSFTVESLVLNPAGTMGTRFLMATIVASVEGAKTAETLRSREAEVRDRLMAVLASKTVDELSDVALREPLKEELRSTLAEMVAPARVVAVFLPTFVIQ